MQPVLIIIYQLKSTVIHNVEFTMKFQCVIGYFMLLSVTACCAVATITVDDYIENYNSGNNGTDYYMEDGSGLPLSTKSPSKSPSSSPTKSVKLLSSSPTQNPIFSLPTVNPSVAVTTLSPTFSLPTVNPSVAVPTLSPTFSLPTVNPSVAVPTLSPTFSLPTVNPSVAVTKTPTFNPTFSLPTINPSVAATKTPTFNPTFSLPTVNPTAATTLTPTTSFWSTTGAKTTTPTQKPTTTNPTAATSVLPTQMPTFPLYSIGNDPIATIARSRFLPTAAPTEEPTAGGGGAGVKRRPTRSPIPTMSPSFILSTVPTRSAASTLSSAPTKAQSKSPSTRPTTAIPTVTSTASPSLFQTAPVDDVHYHSNYTVMVGPVNVYNIFYGDFSSPDATKTTSLINYFTANIGNTSWYNMLTNFYQFSGGVKTSVSPSSLSLKQSIQVPQSNALTEAGIASLIIGKFNSRQLPADPNGIYTIVFRGDISMSNKGYSWLYDWCAYHGAFRIYDGRSFTMIKFIVVGDSSFSPDGNLCQPIPKTTPPNSNIGADNMVAVLGHQIAGTITNSMNFANGQLTQLGAWHFDTSTNGVEIGDPCQLNFGSFSGNYNLIVGQKVFFVPSLWLPGRGCSMKK